MPAWLTSIPTLADLALCCCASLGALVKTAIAKGEGVHKLENVLHAPETLLAGGVLVLLAVRAGAWSLDGVSR